LNDWFRRKPPGGFLDRASTLLMTAAEWKAIIVVRRLTDAK
jgi:hypothetical protein